MNLLRRRVAACLAFFPAMLCAQSANGADTSAANLMVVLRESINANFSPGSMLEYIGRVRFTTEDGKKYEAELAHYAYLADTHIRFVFDGPKMMSNATTADLARLGLSPQRALDLALENIRRVYGEGQPVALRGGLMQLDSKSPDLISSYFLDLSLWSALERKHPEGIVAIVPKRGGLLFAPASDAQAVDILRRNAARLFTGSERLRVSSAVYLFKGGKWSVLQDPVTKE